MTPTRSTSPHILVVNGTKVRRPIFVLGAPHSGTDLVARAIRQSTAFHLTMGRPNVVRTVYAFARRPSIATERGAGAARVMRAGFGGADQNGRVVVVGRYRVAEVPGTRFRRLRRPYEDAGGDLLDHASAGGLAGQPGERRLPGRRGAARAERR